MFFNTHYTYCIKNKKKEKKEQVKHKATISWFIEKITKKYCDLSITIIFCFYKHITHIHKKMGKYLKGRDNPSRNTGSFSSIYT